MDPIVLLAALASGLIGSSATLGVQVWLEERRRWEPERRAVYARFLAAATMQHELASALPSIFEREQRGVIVRDPVRASELAKAFLADRGERWEQSQDELILAESEIRLLGRLEVQKAARQLLRATLAENPILAADDSDVALTTEDGEVIVADRDIGGDPSSFESARSAFERAAQAELRVKV